MCLWLVQSQTPDKTRHNQNECPVARMGWEWSDHRGATQSATRALDCRDLLSLPYTAGITRAPHCLHCSPRISLTVLQIYFGIVFPSLVFLRASRKLGQKKNVPRCKRCDMVHGEGSWVSVLLSNCCTKGISGRKELQPEARRVIP